MNTADRIHLTAAAYQAAQSHQQGSSVVAGLVVVFGLFAFTIGLTRHIRTLWSLAQTFLTPMVAAVKTLTTVILVIIIVVVGLGWSSHEHASAAPAATISRSR